ncbi:MAG: DUF6151 family protein [Luteimonas sp.]
MHVELRCRCGQLRGEVDNAHAYGHARCYCRDCRAYARFLGADDVLDAQGGTAIVAVPPDAIRFTAGEARLACLSLSDTGVLRWYADCCQAPIANTARDARVAYVGVIAGALEPQDRDAAFGPPRFVLNQASPEGHVPGTPLATAIGGGRIFLRLLAARLRGLRNRAFFDAGGAPVRTPQVVDAPRGA